MQDSTDWWGVDIYSPFNKLLQVNIAWKRMTDLSSKTVKACESCSLHPIVMFVRGVDLSWS